MAVNLLQDIDDQIAKLKAQGYTTGGGSDAVNAIGNQDTAGTIDLLSQLRNKNASQLSNYQALIGAVPAKYQGTIDTINKNISDIPAKYQPEYDAHAVDEQTDLRRAVETAANYGQLGGGALPQWQLQASGTRQNADNTTTTNKKNEQVNLQNQLLDTNRQKQQDIDSITNTISSLNDQGETDLQSLLSQGSKNYLADVQKQQTAEEAARAEAAAEAQKLEEQQYEAQLAAQARIDAAQIAAEAKSGGSSGSASSSSSSNQNEEDIADVQTALNRLGYNLNVDGINGPDTKKAVKDYQQTRGLTADGVIGPETMARLEAEMNNANAAYQNPSPDALTATVSPTGWSSGRGRIE